MRAAIDAAALPLAAAPAVVVMLALRKSEPELGRIRRVPVGLRPWILSTSSATESVP